MEELGRGMSGQGQGQGQGRGMSGQGQGQGQGRGMGGQGQGLAGVQGQITVEQVIQMLMQGAAPEELAAQGVPMELIEQAMMAIQQEMQAQGQMPPEQEGLAGMQGGM